MKKTILYTFIFFLLLIAFTLSSCKKDFSGKNINLTDSTTTASVSTVINGHYDYIATDTSGNLYALRYNYGADTIYKIDATGHKNFFYTPPATMDHDTAVINTMGCLTVDSIGNVYTINYSGNMTPSVLKITPGGSGSIIFSNINSGGGVHVEKIAVNQGNFYFSDYGGIHKITSGGSSSLILGTVSVFTVNRDGVIYYPVTSGGPVSLGQLSATGTQYIFPGITLNDMVDIKTDEAGNIFTSEINDDNIVIIHAINPAGTKMVTVISSPIGHVDGPIATAKIGVAFSLAIGNAGSLYFSEITGDPTDIRKISF